MYRTESCWRYGKKGRRTKAPNTSRSTNNSSEPLAHCQLWHISGQINFHDRSAVEFFLNGDGDGGDGDGGGSYAVDIDDSEDVDVFFFWAKNKRAQTSHPFNFF